ncbi:putative phosphatidyl-myo-inositol alpha-mannosyltransferase [Helianthus annuus]|nr:putative phosphatidyl-myo-inositol alpha-mannosyltransferase [Helianthus annuus]KAJ0901990.1 putative phosphatidyl-myo-inositol alpha-mannosyltransferase [Helianthus annuus]
MFTTTKTRPTFLKKTSPPQTTTVMAPTTSKTKRPIFPIQSSLLTTLLCIILFTIPALLLLHTPPASICNTFSTTTPSSFSGDLRSAEFSWNRLSFSSSIPPPVVLKIAVFTRKWPLGTTPGGMERHAYTLYTDLATRGHQIHIFTSPPHEDVSLITTKTTNAPIVHFLEDAEPGQWRYNKAWEQYEEENGKRPFDVIHTESVALPHHKARDVPNLAVSWHGIALESVSSSIYQDLLRRPDEPMSQSFNKSLQVMIPKVLNEIRFFRNYQHHIAISDSCGEMLRDVYQIPSKRVHVIVNGVNMNDFREDPESGKKFRSKIGVPENASLVLGVAGRLVKDKGHPLLYEAFANLIKKYKHVYLVVAGSGPWQQRYMELGSQVIVLGSMNPSELRGFYNAIDIFVNPTLRPQGLDLTLMEAMMAGKPVMASRFPSIKGTILVDDEYGFMFSPNVESLVESLELVVAEGPRRLAQRGKACRRYASSMFTARKMALAYERLFLCIKDETFCIYP